MRPNPLPKLRQQASTKQNHRCYYCELPMWHRDRAAFLRSHAIQPRHASYLKCTAEHLVARQDNGRNTADNIVAACLWCNRMRHCRPDKAPDAATYKARVSRLVSLGRWHPVASSMHSKNDNEMLLAHSALVLKGQFPGGAGMPSEAVQLRLLNDGATEGRSSRSR